MRLTLGRLGDRAGLTPSYIGAIERGTREPSLSTVQALARALGVPVGQLLGGPKLGPEGLRIARLFDSVHPAFRDGLIAIIRSVAHGLPPKARRPPDPSAIQP